MQNRKRYTKYVAEVQVNIYIIKLSVRFNCQLYSAGNEVGKYLKIATQIKQ